MPIDPSHYQCQRLRPSEDGQRPSFGDVREPALGEGPRRLGITQPLVLVIEDDPTIRELMEALLLSEGYRVATAAHGAEGLDQIRQEPPHLILLDWLMPVMDGRAFTRAYRESPGPHAPIIVLAATDPEGRAAEIGAAGYCPKPFDLGSLIRLLKEHLNGQRPGRAL